MKSEFVGFNVDEETKAWMDGEVERRREESGSGSKSALVREALFVLRRKLRVERRARAAVIGGEE